MNKDALLATLIGFIIGLCITGMLLVGPRLMSALPKFSLHLPNLSQAMPKKAPKPTPTPKPATFAIDSPLPESIESENVVLVSGTAQPDSTVVIQGNTDDAVSAVIDDGKFAGKVTLVEGKNILSVTSFSKDKTTTQSITVFYTPETL